MRIAIIERETEDIQDADILLVTFENCDKFVRRLKNEMPNSIVLAPSDYADVKLPIDKLLKLSSAFSIDPEFCQAIVDLSPDAIIVHDGSRILFANRRAAEIAGLSTSELVGKPLIGFVHPEFRKFVLERIKRMFSGERVPPAEEVLLLPDGRELHVEVNSSLIRFRGRPAILLILRDLTERRKFERRLRRLERFFMNARDIFFILDTKGRFIDLNPKFASLFGYEPEELIGRTSRNLVHPDDYAALKTFFRSVLEHGEGVGEFRFIRRDGSTLWLELHEWRFDDEVEGIARDVTAKKEIEKKLRESERKYREFFENTLDVVVVTDLKGRIVEVNRAFEEVLGYSRVEVLGKHYSFIVPEEVAERLYEEYRRAFEERRDLKNVVFEISTKRGRKIVLEGNVRLLRDGERIKGFISNFRDVTERVRLEEQLRRTNELLKRVFKVSELIVREDDLETLMAKTVEILSSYAEVWVAIGRGRVKLYTPNGVLEVDEDKIDVSRCRSFPIEAYGCMYGIMCVHGELSAEEEAIFRSLAEDLALAIRTIELTRAREEVLESLRRNVRDLSEVIDRIRNPLAAIAGYAELVEPELGKKILFQVKRIDAILARLDVDWTRSEDLIDRVRRSL